MISLRFRPYSFSEWTQVRLSGEEERDALTLLGSRLLAAEGEVEIWTGEAWEPLEEWEDADDDLIEDDEDA